MKIKNIVFADEGGRVGVLAIMDDDTRVPLFSYYDDELSFNEEEFIGITVDEAFELFHKKDIAYLQS